MLLQLLSAVLSVAAALPVAASRAAAAPDPRRQFDFWVGEWSVQNRHLQEDGTWRDGSVTRARITPVCGGAAILEEWAGPFRGTFMNGFSLRAWQPASESWKLVLFWTTDGNAAFGQLEGRFRHGRGEFFVPSAGARRTRYTFSDALPDTVRWDSAHSTDSGVTWRTDWIMEFSRTRSAEEATQERLLRVDWTEGRVSPHAAARELDFMLGSWRGVQTLADGTEREARLDCKLLAKGCLVLDLLRTRATARDEWSERLAVRGFEASPARWVGWRVSEDDSRLVRGTGESEAGAVTFRDDARGAGGAAPARVEYLVPVEDGRIQLEVARLQEGDAVEVVSSTVLERVER